MTGQECDSAKLNSTGGWNNCYSSFPLEFGGGSTAQFRRCLFSLFRRLRGLETPQGRRQGFVKGGADARPGAGGDARSKEGGRYKAQRSDTNEAGGHGSRQRPPGTNNYLLVVQRLTAKILQIMMQARDPAKILILAYFF